MENLTESRSSVIGLATKKFHERCMPFVWKSQSAAEKLEKRKAGLVKRYGSVSVLNQIVPSLSIKSAPIQNTITIKTFGGTVVKLQSTHPRGGCDIFCFCFSTTCRKLQSTHPRGVRSSYGYHDEEPVDTSIHAPAGGAMANITNYVAKASFLDTY